MQTHALRFALGEDFSRGGSHAIELRLRFDAATPAPIVVVFWEAHGVDTGAMQWF